MNEYFIGNVKLDFSAYDGKDSYSDGSIEDEILFHIRTGNEENFLRNDNRWPVFYYLSPLRHFLLEWLPLEKDDSVLEIGCGCGALTGSLIQKGATVEAVELSPRRAQICALRNRHADNLTIHVGNFNAMNFNKKFDVVLLIGVLEYAGRFTHTKNPHIDFLNKCKEFLKPGGALVIAIENRLGIEYFSGKLEDHTGKIFDGIIDYPDSNGIKTFSRLELKNLLRSCGFVEQKFFYPYPDYKFPFIIHSDEILPTFSDFAHYEDFFYDKDRIQLFSLSQALPTIINAGLYSELANSFLIIAKQTNEKERILPLKIVANNCPRKPKYQLRTEIHKAQTTSGFVVKKIARNPLAREHLKAMVDNCRILSEIYDLKHIAQMKLITDDIAEVEYIDGISFENYLCRTLQKGSFDEFVKGLNFYFQNILRGTDDYQEFSNDIIEFNSPDRRYDWDSTFINIMIRDNDFVLFDYEFFLPTLPKKFVAWRTFNFFYHTCGEFLQRCNVSHENLIAPMNLTPDTIKKYEIQDQVIWHTLADIHDKNYRKRRLQVKSFKFE